MPRRKSGYTKADLAAVDFPELTNKELAQLRPARGVLTPETLQHFKGRGLQKTPTKIPISIRLDHDLVVELRAKGPGWQRTVNTLLRKAVGLK
jgi:uncharacterized protein (DUF4415 family)